MLHAAPPLEAAGSPLAHSRCLLRDLSGHGAVPADPSPLYDADAATARFLLERNLRETGIARRRLPPSSSPGSSATDAADAADSGEPAREDQAEPAASPSDPSPLYGADAATTRFLLERILRETGIARCRLPPSSSPGSSATDAADAADSGEPALEDQAEPAASPADPSPLYGADAATTRFLLERILRETGIARRRLPPSSSPGSSATDAADAADSGEPAPEDQAEPAASPVPVSGAEDRGSAASGSGTSPSTAVHAPFESTADVPGSRLRDIVGRNGRILIVANRLHVTAKRLKDNTWGFVTSSGGLVSALEGVKGVEMKWVGWPGVSVPGEADQTFITTELSKKRCIPVFLDEELMDQYYSGYCNNILWPLFHYLGLPQGYKFNKAKDFESQLTAYTQANQMFADTVCKIYKEGDIIWCHDYHLMLLPKLLKQSNSSMKVGWFLHTPFPSSEVYQALPNRKELLEAVLNADLVGFHTYEYARNFVSACTSLLGLEGCFEGIKFEGKFVKVDAFPIGIDFERFGQCLNLDEVKEKISGFEALFAGRQVMLGVDRLDMIKGFLQKLLAFEKFLEKNEEMASKVVLVQIAVPTRSAVPEYQELKSQVHELVSRVNGKFGTLEKMPIIHLDKTLEFEALCALYAVTDVALITSLRDGMNLVSYEYVACQESKKGVLILSEFAGSAQSLRAGAIVVNPWDIAEVAKAIEDALNMSAEEKDQRHRHNYEIVSAYTAQDWAENYVRELDAAIKAQLGTGVSVLELPIEEAAVRYTRSKSRLLILGFNATLTEQVQSFERTATDETGNMTLKLNPGLKGTLKTLCDHEDTTAIVVSGYGKRVLDENFREFKMWLAAENGMFHRRNGEDWITKAGCLEIGCQDSVKKVAEYFTKRTPKSYCEPRETSFVWNYKYADDQLGTNQAKDMIQQLRVYSLSNRGAEVIQGSRSIEVRHVGVTKGNAIAKLMQELGHRKTITTPIDYVLCIGHFLEKDENVYTLFNFADQTELEDCMGIKFDLKRENYFPCTVGRERSQAQYRLKGTSDVVSLLHCLASAGTDEDDGSPLTKWQKRDHDSGAMGDQ